MPEALILKEHQSIAALSPDAEAATVWYFGESYANWIDLIARLPAGWRPAPVGTVLNRWAQALGEELRNIDATLEIGDAVDWVASGIGCRGRYETPLVLMACRYAAFIEAMESGGRHVAVVSDTSFGRLLLRAARSRGWTAWWERPGGRPPWPVREAWAHARELVVGRLAGMLRTFRQLLILRRLRRRHPLERETLRQADTVLVLWGRATTFRPDGKLGQEGYFGRLPELLESRGSHLAFFVNPLVWMDSYQTIVGNTLLSGAPVMLIEDAITIGDVVRAALRSLRPPARTTAARRGNPDLTPVLRLALAYETRRQAPRAAHLLPKLGPFLRELGMRPRRLIHLYEGQPWERSLRAGLRQALPETAAIAVQHMPFPPLYLNFIPSRREIEDGGLPDRLLVLGPVFADFFRALGLPEAMVVVGGAARFEAITTLGGGDRPAASDTVLCCAGVDWEESHELVDKAAQAVMRLPGLRLLVNFNPLADLRLKTAVRRFVLGRLPADCVSRIDFSDLGVRELVGRASLVIYCDTNAAFEAFAAGLALIFVERDYGLDYNKLPDGWARRCRSVDEIVVALTDWQNRPELTNREERQRQLRRYLAPVNDENILRSSGL